MQIVARRLLFDSSHTAQRGPGVEGSTLRVSDSDFPYDLSGSSQLGKRLMPIEIDKAVKEAVDAGAASVFGKEALPSREEVGRHCQHLLGRTLIEHTTPPTNVSLCRTCSLESPRQ